jgi:hypothetical protein
VENLNLKKLFLYTLIGSVAFSAVLGIGVILFGSFGEFETKILLTTLTITVTSILGLACGAYLETGRGKILPLAGIVCAVLSAILWVILIWSNKMGDDTLAKVLMSTTLLAAACSHISLLSMAKLDKKFVWLRQTAQASIWALTGIILLLIWTETDPSDGWVARLMGVLSIVIGALTVVTPILHWLSRETFESKEETVQEIEAEITRLKDELARLETRREEILKK